MSKSIPMNNIFIIFLMIFTLVMVTQSANAGSPVIIRHDASIMEREIKINLAWQSDEPVAKIITSAGSGQVIINNVDNERTERGYSGEIDIVIPAYLYNVSGDQSMYMSRQSSSPFQQNSMEMYANSGSPSNEMVQYTIQLIDEVNQRSTLLKDNVRRSELSRGGIAGHNPQTKTTSGTMIVNAKDPLNTAINTAIGLIAKNGAAPVIKNLKMQNWTDNRASFSFDATDDKGVVKIVYEVRDPRGYISTQGFVPCNSDKSCSGQSDYFTLNAGNYVLSATAVDTDNNNSVKSELPFQVQNNGTGNVQQPVQQNQLQTIQQTPQQVTSPVPSQMNTPGVTYENQ